MEWFEFWSEDQFTLLILAALWTTQTHTTPLYLVPSVSTKLLAVLPFSIVLHFIFHICLFLTVNASRTFVLALQ